MTVLLETNCKAQAFLQRNVRFCPPYKTKNATSQSYNAQTPPFTLERTPEEVQMHG